MKCFYYLTPTLASTQQISDDLHEAGIGDWFIHVISKDETGLKKEHVHSGNYIEKLDILRDGIIGAVLGFIGGLLVAVLMGIFEPFGPDVPGFVYLVLVIVLTLFGAWNGGLMGVASENKKMSEFHDDIDAGKYLILIYARKKEEDTLKAMMASKHSEAHLSAVDANFFNPLTKLKRI